MILWLTYIFSLYRACYIISKLQRQNTHVLLEKLSIQSYNTIRYDVGHPVYLAYFLVFWKQITCLVYMNMWVEPVYCSACQMVVRIMFYLAIVLEPIVSWSLV